MTRHYNPTITERLLRTFRPKTGDMFSDELSPNVVAVVPVTPITNIIRTASTNTTAGGTIFTTPDDKDFYLTDVMLSASKNAACDVVIGTYAALQITVNGLTVQISRITSLTATDQNDTVVLNFTFPIKIDRDTIISIASSSYTAGLSSRNATIYGYTEETIST